MMYVVNFKFGVVRYILAKKNLLELNFCFIFVARIYKNVSHISGIFRMKVGVLMFFLLLFGGQARLIAQEDTLRRSVDEVVVTATRISVSRHNVPMTVSVVNRDEIEKRSESALLPALSGYVPGMFITQRGVTGFGVANGGTGAISMRGFGGSPTTELLVLIDGHPQYMGIMGHHLPDAYVASDVEKVEVIRGPASILYGSNAMGGAINIITRRQDREGWSANGRMMAGSYNTQKYMFNGGVKKGKINGFMSINHDRTDGHRPNSDFTITNGYAKIGYEPNGHFQLWSDMSLAGFETQNPGTITQPLTDSKADILRGVASATMENNYEKTSGAFKFFFNFGNHKVYDGYAAGAAPKNYFFQSNDYNYGITLYQSFRPFAGNLITAGIDYKRFGGQAWNEFTDVTPKADLLPKTTIRELAGYVMMQHTLFDKLTLNAGLRLDNNEVFGSEWIPQAGCAYRPLQHTVVKASVSKGFRSPTIREMYMFPPQNPDLLPERMVNYETSVGQGFFDGQLTAELTGYVAVGSNLIMTQMVNGSPKNLNVGDFTNKGLELAVKWNILKNLAVKGNYSYLNMQKPVLNVPRQQAFFEIDYRLKKWIVSANYQYIQGLYLKLEGDAVTESYGLLNMKVSFCPLRWLDIFVKGENLTAKSYEIVYGYPMPGITFFGGMNLKFSL